MHLDFALSLSKRNAGEWGGEVILVVRRNGDPESRVLLLHSFPDSCKVEFKVQAPSPPCPHHRNHSPRCLLSGHLTHTRGLIVHLFLFFPLKCLISNPQCSSARFQVQNLKIPWSCVRLVHTQEHQNCTHRLRPREAAGRREARKDGESGGAAY